MAETTPCGAPVRPPTSCASGLVGPGPVRCSTRAASAARLEQLGPQQVLVRHVDERGAAHRRCAAAAAWATASVSGLRPARWVPPMAAASASSAVPATVAGPSADERGRGRRRTAVGADGERPGHGLRPGVRIGHGEGAGQHGRRVRGRHGDVARPPAGRGRSGPACRPPARRRRRRPCRSRRRTRRPCVTTPSTPAPWAAAKASRTASAGRWGRRRRRCRPAPGPSAARTRSPSSLRPARRSSRAATRRRPELAQHRPAARPRPPAPKRRRCAGSAWLHVGSVTPPSWPGQRMSVSASWPPSTRTQRAGRRPRRR